MSNANPRTALRKLIADNAEHIKANLHEMIHRQIEDLTAAGIDYRKVADAALYVACCHQQKIMGTASWIEALRDLADDYERRLMSNSKKSAKPN
jgi:hypothetical protein